MHFTAAILVKPSRPDLVAMWSWPIPPDAITSTNWYGPSVCIRSRGHYTQGKGSTRISPGHVQAPTVLPKDAAEEPARCSRLVRPRRGAHRDRADRAGLHRSARIGSALAGSGGVRQRRTFAREPQETC